jgi:hypothetical protein
MAPLITYRLLNDIRERVLNQFDKLYAFTAPHFRKSSEQKENGIFLMIR